MLAGMNADARDCRALSLQAVETLKRGEPRKARELFEQAIAAGAGDADTWFGLSLAHQNLGATQAESAALDKTLEVNTRHLPALIRKGDLYTGSGDRRSATTYYRAALKLGATLQGLSPDWRAKLDHIEGLCQQNAQAYEEHLFADLTRRGLGGPGTARFARAMDLVLGKRQIYHQQPRYFHFPELPEIEIFERQPFPWVAALEEATAAIREELRAAVASGTGFVPYLQKEANRPAFTGSGLLNDTSWSAFHLFKAGEPVAENAARCPKTMQALAQVPLCRIQGRTPTVMFSLLRPGARIPPHHGYLNTRLICHLPLVVPADCALRVGNQTHRWREGELVIFDDTIEHEAWNNSPELRVVLLFDIWRPELTDIERSLIAEVLESIDRFGGPRREWTQ